MKVRINIDDTVMEMVARLLVDFTIGDEVIGVSVTKESFSLYNVGWEWYNASTHPGDLVAVVGDDGESYQGEIVAVIRKGYVELHKDLMKGNMS